MTPSTSDYHWVREVNPDLKNLDSIPLTGAAPPFPWEDFSDRLSRSFEKEGIRIEPGEICWRPKETLYQGMGNSPFPLNLSVPPLQGEVTWVMPVEEISTLAALLLTKDSHPLPLHDNDFTESFTRFLTLEVLHQFRKLQFDETLFPVLTHQGHLPSEDSLCWEIRLHIDSHNFLGRLIISTEFRASWVAYFAEKQATSLLSQKMSQLATVHVHLEAGKTELTLGQWMTVKLGDVVVLDSCSLDLDTFTGRLTLTHNGKTAFRAKLKDGALKILELPLLHEVNTSMAQNPEDENEMNDLNLDEDLFFDLDDELFDEDEGNEEKVDSAEAEERDVPPKKKKDKNGKESENTPSAASTLLAPKQIPVNIVVEIGQVEMTMEQLIKLEPGNLLDVNLNPKNGVDLTINGKLVGKGELVRIGDIIGVRILELGR